MFCMFTKRGEYAHRAAMALAASSTGNGYVKARDLAEQENIPLPFLKKLIAALKQRGIVDTRTGKQGGVVLRNEPANISLWDIVNAVEKAPNTSACPFPSNGCRYRALCTVSAHWSDLTTQILDRMRTVTLADLLKVRTDTMLASARHEN